MKSIIEKTTQDTDFINLSEMIDDDNLHLFLSKCLITYPEYKFRLSAAKSNALNEARVFKYSESYTRAFVHYRVEMERWDVHRDMCSAFELLSAKLLFKNPDVLKTEQFLKLSRYIKELPSKEIYLEDY